MRSARKTPSSEPTPPGARPGPHGPGPAARSDGRGGHAVAEDETSAGDRSDPRKARSRETRIHGALVDVRGTGVLLLGASGLGKSETALELVIRGHRLVADDVVRLKERSDGTLEGRAPDLIRYHLEVRGIGIVDVAGLYGPGAVAERASVDLVCRIVPWKDGLVVERVGLERACERVAGRPLPSVVLPARPSGNLATLVDLAVRDHQDRAAGGESGAQRLDARIQEAVRRGRPSSEGEAPEDEEE